MHVHGPGLREAKVPAKSHHARGSEFGRRVHPATWPLATLEKAASTQAWPCFGGKAVSAHDAVQLEWLVKKSNSPGAGTDGAIKAT
jgi:hypothetical protein